MFEIIDESRLIGADLSGTILRGIHDGTPELRDTLLGKVIDRTPYLTGALQADETGTYTLDRSSPELVQLYTGTENQLEAPSIYGEPRIYAAAIEVGSPDNPFNPTDGHHMFGNTATENIPDIEEWGVKRLNSGIYDITGGRSLRL